MIRVEKPEITKALNYPDLLSALKLAFRSESTTPLRHHHQLENPVMGIPSTLLLMPSWQTGEYLGIKIITVSPNNQQLHLPAIQGLYLLFDAKNGSPLAMMDARYLTSRRTAAASALASQYLSRVDSDSLLMVGTGALAPELIRAHQAVRPIKKLFIWGRNRSKATTLAKQFEDDFLEVTVVDQLNKISVSQAAIISCATMTEKPLIKGEWLVPGQHIDLVGSYQPHTREADDEVIRRGNIYVDTFEGATTESGDILIPIQQGLLSKSEILGDLFGLCSEKATGRLQADQITIFKSVGHALEDLAAARLIYSKISQ